MALDYYHFETSSSPIYSKTSGIAPAASTITKDNSLDLANPSCSSKLYHSNKDSPYHNPIVIVVTPESSYNEDPFNFKTVKIKKDNPLVVYLLAFIIFVLIMIYKKR